MSRLEANDFNGGYDRAEEPAPEGKTQVLAVVPYRNLTDLKFSLVTREQVPTEFIFADLLPGDSKATITVVEGDDRWAVVDIRILARKPYTTREIEK